MRKIERMLHDAFWSALRKKADNTRILVDGERVTLELFGHEIARRQAQSSAVRFTLAGHNTQTTRSRLKNVCELPIHSRGRTPFYGETPIDVSAWYLVSERGGVARKVNEQ